MVQTSTQASEDVPFIRTLMNTNLFHRSLPLPDSHQSYSDPGTTLLHFATRKHSMELAQFLLSYGASPATPDPQGQTPLQLAQKLGFREFVDLLENHIASNDDKDSAKTPVGDYGAYFQALVFHKCLTIHAENESDSDTFDWKQLSPYDPYFQQKTTAPQSSLPVHSVPEVDRVRSLIGNGVKRTVAIFTPLESLESVQVDSDFEHIRDRLTQEWQQISTWIIGIIGIDIAAYALSPDSLFQVSRIGKVAIGASGLTISIAALCNLYLLSRFSSLEPCQFKAAATDLYDTFVCFAILARVPRALVAISMGFLATLLIEVAYRLSPSMTLIVGLALGAVLFLQYIAMMIDWMIWILVTLILRFSHILKAACQWVVFCCQRAFHRQLPVAP